MKKQYIIEHMDELGKWTTLEYIHICEIVKDENTVFTNFVENEDSVFGEKYKPRCFQKSINELKDVFDFNRICLLDMKADKTLTYEDCDKFDYFIFGGILGNVPSEDRTSVLRKMSFPFSRNLGTVQMTTNTAVLVCHMIANDKVKLDDIPYIDSPELYLHNNDKESILLPFRYVSKYYYTKDEKDKEEPILPEQFVEYLETLGDQSVVIDDLF